MDWTEFFSICIDQIARQLKFFATHTVRAFIFSGVNMARIFERLQKLLHSFCMSRFSCANKVIVCDIQRAPIGLPRICYESINPVLRSNVILFCSTHNFLPVLVGTGKKPYRLTALAMPSRQYISCNRCVCMPNMGGIIDIVNRCCQVEGFHVRHLITTYSHQLQRRRRPS